MTENDLIPLEKKYIAVVYDQETQDCLRQFCEKYNFDLSTRFDKTKQDPKKFTFHSTVWWTTTEHQIENHDRPTYVIAKPVSFELFGAGKNILVVELESPDLEQIRQQFGENYKMEDEWLSYRPHVTLCYNYQGDMPDENILKDLPVLTADKLQVKKQRRL